MLNLDTHVLLHAIAGTSTPKERRLLVRDTWGISAIVLWEIAKLAQKRRIARHARTGNHQSNSIQPRRIVVAQANFSGRQRLAIEIAAAVDQDELGATRPEKSRGGDSARAEPYDHRGDAFELHLT